MFLVNSMVACALQEALLEYLPVGLRLPGLVQWVLRYTPKVSRLIKQVIYFSADNPHVSHTRIVFLATCLKCDISNTFLPLCFERPMECRWRPCFETSQSGELSWTPGAICCKQLSRVLSAWILWASGDLFPAHLWQGTLQQHESTQVQCSQAHENGGDHSRHGGGDMWG